jgi:hypothetical protein
MKIYHLAQNKEIWVDAEGKVVYIKGEKFKEPRLTWIEFREAMDMNAPGSVTKTLENGSEITYYAPFKKME